MLLPPTKAYHEILQVIQGNPQDNASWQFSHVLPCWLLVRNSSKYLPGEIMPIDFIHFFIHKFQSICHHSAQGVRQSSRGIVIDGARIWKSIHYKDKTFETLKGRGFQSNYIDLATGDQYWISGCRKDGMEALFSADIAMDEDVREEYWTEIRGLSEKRNIANFRAKGKYSGGHVSHRHRGDRG